MKYIFALVIALSIAVIVLVGCASKPNAGDQLFCTHGQVYKNGNCIRP